MAGGLSYESWTDAPIGMQAAQADKIIERFRNASSQFGAAMKETPQPPPVAAPVRPINANAIKYWEHTECGGHGCYVTVRTVTDEEIAKMPTLDAVEVVRCKHCQKTREKTEYEAAIYVPEALVCIREDIFGDPENEIVLPNHYCSYGERR